MKAYGSVPLLILSTVRIVVAQSVNLPPEAREIAGTIAILPPVEQLEVIPAQPYSIETSLSRLTARQQITEAVPAEYTQSPLEHSGPIRIPRDPAQLSGYLRQAGW